MKWIELKEMKWNQIEFLFLKATMQSLVRPGPTTLRRARWLPQLPQPLATGPWPSGRSSHTALLHLWPAQWIRPPGTHLPLTPGKQSLGLVSSKDVSVGTNASVITMATSKSYSHTHEHWASQSWRMHRLDQGTAAKGTWGLDWTTRTRH